MVVASWHTHSVGVNHFPAAAFTGCLVIPYRAASTAGRGPSQPPSPQKPQQSLTRRDPAPMVSTSQGPRLVCCPLMRTYSLVSVARCTLRGPCPSIPPICHAGATGGCQAAPAAPSGSPTWRPRRWGLWPSSWGSALDWPGRTSPAGPAQGTTHPGTFESSAAGAYLCLAGMQQTCRSSRGTLCQAVQQLGAVLWTAWVAPSCQPPLSGNPGLDSDSLILRQLLLLHLHVLSCDDCGYCIKLLTVMCPRQRLQAHSVGNFPL